MKFTTKIIKIAKSYGVIIPIQYIKDGSVQSGKTYTVEVLEDGSDNFV